MQQTPSLKYPLLQVRGPGAFQIKSGDGINSKRVVGLKSTAMVAEGSESLLIILAVNRGLGDTAMNDRDGIKLDPRELLGLSQVEKVSDKTTDSKSLGRLLSKIGGETGGGNGGSANGSTVIID